ncbi:MAG: hypothetical protein U5N58_10550 [Actinomycetota bacterium]|nr:hypothetical protein [Actinomycetota bacterium]
MEQNKFRHSYRCYGRRHMPPDEIIKGAIKASSLKDAHIVLAGREIESKDSARPGRPLI